MSRPGHHTPRRPPDRGRQRAGALTSTARAPQRSPRDSARVRSLDGVRGVAALVVVVHHALQLHPTFARVQAEQSATGESATVWALTHTPLHVLWAGEEAVLVFFVLSGFVLALPATRGPVAWGRYYPRRLVRLYLPVWASLVVAVGLRAALPPGAPTDDRSPWLQDRATAPLGEVWHDAALLDGTGLLNSPLWSLRWEVLFSLALPAYLLLLRRRRPWVAVAEAGALVGLIGLGTMTDSLALRYLPVFGLGVLLAHHDDRLAGVVSWVQRRRHAGATWALVGVGIATLLTARWLVDGLPSPPRVLEAVASAATILGAVAVVLLPLGWAGCARALESPAAQWLGVRSFSLYLVHEPVLVAVALGLPVAWGVWPAALVGGVAALGATTLFFRYVERPSIALARRAGGRGPGRSRQAGTRSAAVQPAVQDRSATSGRQTG